MEVTWKTMHINFISLPLCYAIQISISRTSITKFAFAMSCINCAHRKHYIIIKVLFPLVRAEYTLGQKEGPNWMCLL